MDMELIENKYMILYYKSNQIDVYLLNSEIYITFHMRLPRYAKYKDYKFTTDDMYPGLITRTSQGGMLAVLMNNQNEA